MPIYYDHEGVTIYNGHVLDELKALPDESVNCCVTSPPYLWLRDYGNDPVIWGGEADCKHDWVETIRPNGCGTGKSFRRDREAGLKRGDTQPGFCKKCGAWFGCLGLEPTPELFVEHLVMVFREVKRVLRHDGILWLNIGDTYASRNNGINPGKSDAGFAQYKSKNGLRSQGIPTGYKHKDLIGVPWMAAFALRADGWYLRQDIIWYKPNAQPDSAKDRPSNAYEHLFLLAKNDNYFYDANAIKEKTATRLEKMPDSWDTGPGAHGSYHRVGREKGKPKHKLYSSRNKRNVWTIATQSFPEAHFATFPEKLVEPCIKAGCPEGGVVLDPFFGSGTSGLVAKRLGCRVIGIDQSPEYCEMAINRINSDQFEFKFGAQSK